MGICDACETCSCITFGERDLASSFGSRGWETPKPVLRLEQLAETTDVPVGDPLPEGVRVTGKEVQLVFATRESVAGLIQSLQWIEANWDAIVQGVLDAKSE